MGAKCSCSAGCRCPACEEAGAVLFRNCRERPPKPAHGGAELKQLEQWVALPVEDEEECAGGEFVPVFSVFEQQRSDTPLPPKRRSTFLSPRCTETFDASGNIPRAVSSTTCVVDRETSLGGTVLTPRPVIMGESPPMPAAEEKELVAIQDSYLSRASQKQEGRQINEHLLHSLSQCEAPFRVIPYHVLKANGKLPRSDAQLAVLGSQLPPGMKVAFLSHRWLRPWHTQEECEANGHRWDNGAHPDDEHNTKFHLLIAGIEQVAAERSWSLDSVAVWLDFACIDQDDIELRLAGVRSLLGYMTRCRFVIIPALTAPTFPTVHRMTGDYGSRAWTRLEAFGFYVLSIMSNFTRPELYYSAPGKARQEGILLDVLHSYALAGCGTAVGPAMVAAAGLGNLRKVMELLDNQVAVDTQDNSGVTALWSASRQGHEMIVRQLLSMGASLEMAPDSGLAPLHCAALAGHAAVVQILIDNRADLNQKDSQGLTPLGWAKKKWNEEVMRMLIALHEQELKREESVGELQMGIRRTICN